MSLEIRVSGGAKLELAAKQIKAVGNRGLGQVMRRRLEEAAKPLEIAVRAEAERVMPSGYRATFTAALRFKKTIKASARTAEVVFRTYADGKGERRDVNRLEAGQLKHPVFGRARRTKAGLVKNPWATTRIRAGFWTRPVDENLPKVRDALISVLDDVIAELKG